MLGREKSGKERGKWLVKRRGRKKIVSTAIYPYLPMATNAPWSVLGGEAIKSLILSFNIQKCEFCAQI